MLVQYSIHLLFLLLGSQQITGQENNACNSLLGYWFKSISPGCFHNPDVGLNTPAMLELHTERYENHTVTTEDGYILHLFRIPRANPKGVIIMQHPVTVDSFVYVGQLNTSFAYWLYDQGYEIWLPNQRGTFLSEKHVNLTTDDYEYWNYTFHEVGIYDYSSFITYISNVTNNTQLIFIGHSQAGTSSIIYASLKPEEAKKYVKIFILMSPSTAFHDPSLILRLLRFIRAPAISVAKALKWDSFLRYDSLLGKTIRFILHLPIKGLVIGILSLTSGWTPTEFDLRWYTELATQFPRACSIKLLDHYGQCLRGTFSFFDYGKTENLARYNSTAPPDYPLGAIVAPFYIIASKKDAIATVADNRILYSKLGDSARTYGMLEIDHLNHIDIQYGKDKETLLYEPINEILNKL